MPHVSHLPMFVTLKPLDSPSFCFHLPSPHLPCGLPAGLSVQGVRVYCDSAAPARVLHGSRGTHSAQALCFSQCAESAPLSPHTAGITASVRAPCSMLRVSGLQLSSLLRLSGLLSQWVVGQQTRSTVARGSKDGGPYGGGRRLGGLYLCLHRTRGNITGSTGSASALAQRPHRAPPSH